jgi:ABC-type multidrug transport system fused ATPase/permease subunit
LVILLTSLLRSFAFMKVNNTFIHIKIMDSVKLFLFFIILLLTFHQSCLRASSTLHDKLFVKVFGCPMRFFDSTPVGRIINIFSRDLDESINFYQICWDCMNI